MHMEISLLSRKPTLGNLLVSFPDSPLTPPPCFSVLEVTESWTGPRNDANSLGTTFAAWAGLHTTTCSEAFYNDNNNDVKLTSPIQ